MTIAECKIKLATLATNRGRLERKMLSCAPHEVNGLILAQECINTEIVRIGRELTRIHQLVCERYP